MLLYLIAVISSFCARLYGLRGSKRKSEKIIRISSNSLEFLFEKDKPESKKEAKIVGADLGYVNLATLSDGQRIGVDMNKFIEGFDKQKKHTYSSQAKGIPGIEENRFFKNAAKNLELLGLAEVYSLRSLPREFIGNKCP